jgi:hypothetical protein
MTTICLLTLLKDLHLNINISNKFIRSILLIGVLKISQPMWESPTRMQVSLASVSAAALSPTSGIMRIPVLFYLNQLQNTDKNIRQISSK